MKRWLFNILVVVSFLLFLASAYVWIASFWKSTLWPPHQATPAKGDTRTLVEASHGTFSLSRFFYPSVPYSKVDEIYRDTPKFEWHRIGIRYTFWHLTRPDGSLMCSHWHLAIPGWPICLLLAAAPVAWSVRSLLARRRRRRAPGRCPNCSYDLRAHSPGGNCPECGTAIPPIPVAKP